eukprot:COSAG06_NODE_22484_length_722_cov_0.802568_1_plen_94_part_10
MSLDAGLTDEVLVSSSAVSVWDKSQRRSLTICIFVACTGFFHGYDNGVVNGVFEMAPFREHMGWPPTVMDCAAMDCTVTIDGRKQTLQTGDVNP